MGGCSIVGSSIRSLLRFFRHWCSGSGRSDLHRVVAVVRIRHRDWHAERHRACAGRAQRSRLAADDLPAHQAREQNAIRTSQVHIVCHSKIFSIFACHICSAALFLITGMCWDSIFGMSLLEKTGCRQRRKTALSQFSMWQLTI